MLEVRDICVAFDGKSVLDHVSMDVAEGELVALVGPSGSGKSTLLRVIAGLQECTSGSVHWAGQDITHTPTHRRGVGFVFQDEQLFPHRDVAQNIGFGLRMAGEPKAAVADRVRELLDMVGLPGFERRSVTTLSGGEAKRVALARALAPRPRLVLLDEPLTGLDQELHDRLADDLRRVLERTGVSAVLVTHDRKEADRIADRIVRLADLRLRVCEEPTAATYDLRKRVLRAGTPTQDVTYAQDDLRGTVHLVARLGDEVVATSTWADEAWPDEPGLVSVRLRGMAVEPSLQGTGAGAVVVRAGLERAWRSGADLVWASARDSALGFYERLGFEVVGEEFIDETTALPHHYITMRSSRRS